MTTPKDFLLHKNEIVKVLDELATPSEVQIVDGLPWGYLGRADTIPLPLPEMKVSHEVWEDLQVVNRLGLKTWTWRLLHLKYWVSHRTPLRLGLSMLRYLPSFWRGLSVAIPHYKNSLIVTGTVLLFLGLFTTCLGWSMPLYFVVVATCVAWVFGILLPFGMFGVEFYFSEWVTVPAEMYVNRV